MRFVLFVVFVLLRLSLAVCCLLGFVTAPSVWGPRGLVRVGGVLFLGALAFLAVVSIKLIRRRPGVLKLMGWMLTLESLGAAGLVLGRSDIRPGAFNTLANAVLAIGFGLLWATSNALIFYSERVKLELENKSHP
jgi:hypothetical protein